MMVCFVIIGGVQDITTHLLSIEWAHWPKLHDMFKARDAIAWQREFAVGFPVEVSALNSLFINIFHDVVARIEYRCVIKAKHVLLVCWFVRLFVSLLSHFWLIHLFYLHLLYQPYVGLCQATRVQSHQRKSTSAVAIATCEVQVSAADYQTVPTVATGVSKPLCCRLTLTFTLTSENLSLYITLLL